jgi:hypothetical protein
LVTAGLWHPTADAGRYGSGVNIVALTVPPDVDVARVKARLRHGEEAGMWAFEEGCISDEWASA